MTTRLLGRWPLAALCALAVWFAGLALVWRAFEPTGRVLVIAPGSRALASVEATDVALLNSSAGFITVAGRSRGFVRELYANGAWLVLPASGSGCRSPKRAPQLPSV